MRLLFFCFLFTAALVKRRVDCVEIFAVEIVLRDSQGIGETVRVKHLTSCESYSTINLVTHSSGKTYSTLSIFIE